jgi:hypothetical protein
MHRHQINTAEPRLYIHVVTDNEIQTNLNIIVRRWAWPGVVHLTLTTLTLSEMS